MNRVLVVLSGGQDSTTCLFWAIEGWGVNNVHAVTYDYNQRHAIEIEAAVKVASLAGITARHSIVEIGHILQGSSPLVSNETLAQYPDMHSLPGGLEKTYVPGRNMLFATLAANHAYARGITDIVMGVCQADSAGYPDCRQDFIDSVESAIRLGFGYDDNDPFSKFTIHAPLMDLTKAETVLRAYYMPPCWEALAYTHTSYDGQYPPTGMDHATLLRAKGFFEADLPDPLILRAVREGLMDIPGDANYRGR